MGLSPGKIYHNGQQKVEVRNGVAWIAGTDIMCGRLDLVLHLRIPSPHAILYKLI